MKWEEFKRTDFSVFLKTCLNDLPWTRQCWEQADSLEEFYKKFFATEDREVRTSQGYAELSRTASWSRHNEHCMQMLRKADERIVTDSDRAGLKVGSDSFSVLVPNDGRDGETRTYVFKKGNMWFNPDLLDECRYFATLEGELSLYENDCDGEKIYNLSGKFFVYTAKGGKIIFDEWKEEPKMKYLKRSCDGEFYIDSLEEAKKMISPLALPEEERDGIYKEYMEEVAETASLEEFADVWNKYTDVCEDGSSLSVKEL